MGLKLRAIADVFLETLISMRFAIITISALMAIGFLTRYCGMDATLGLALARTGVFYPFFGTLIGWLGTASTGSDTSSNVLFGSLQKLTAQQLGISPYLMTSANSTGGVMGKMIAPQSIVVATTATNQYGSEGIILRFVFLHSLALACLMGLLGLARSPLAATHKDLPSLTSKAPAELADRADCSPLGQSRSCRPTAQAEYAHQTLRAPRSPDSPSPLHAL